MNFWTIIVKEIQRRPAGFLTSSIAIIAALTVLISVRMVGSSSYAGLMEDLHDIGSGYLVISRNARAVDIFQGESGVPMLPESVIKRLASSGLRETDNMYPRIYRRIHIDGFDFILTGVLPPDEIKVRQDLSIANTFLDKIIKRPGSAHMHRSSVEEISNEMEEKMLSPINDPGRGEMQTDSPSSDRHGTAMISSRASRIENNLYNGLQPGEVIVGSAVAQTLSLARGSDIRLMDRGFKVKNILQSTGSRDDARIFVHLHTAQELCNAGNQISSVEILGCCVDKESAPILKAGIENNFKDLRLVTIEEVAKTRMNVFSLSKKIALPLVLVLLVVGAASIASHTIGSLRSRRREIGILISLGAPRMLIEKLFIGRALILGICSGLTGFALGSFIGWFIGRILLDYPVVLAPQWLLLSILGALFVTVASTLAPLLREYRHEVALVLREE